MITLDSSFYNINLKNRKKKAGVKISISMIFLLFLDVTKYGKAFLAVPKLIKPHFCPVFKKCQPLIRMILKGRILYLVRKDPLPG